MTVFLATHMDCSRRGIINLMNKFPTAFDITVWQDPFDRPKSFQTRNPDQVSTDHIQHHSRVLQPYFIYLIVMNPARLPLFFFYLFKTYFLDRGEFYTHFKVTDQ